LFFGLLLMSCQEKLPYTPVTAQHEHIRYTGRFLPIAPDTVRFGWSGSTVELAFEGTSCQMELQNVSSLQDGYGQPQHNFFEVWVDDHPPFTLQATNDSLVYTLAAGLSDTLHTLKVFKRTEAAVGYCNLIGFRLDLGRTLQPLPYPPKQRAIAFVGNSITCGYGNEGDSARCKFTPATENGYLAYGSLTAQNLDARYLAVASSGIGVYRNYNQERTDTMNEAYGRYFLQNDSLRWPGYAQPADVVVISLGTNDLAKGLPERQAFADAYLKLMAQAREYHPKAVFICLVSPMVTDAYPKRERRRSRLRQWIGDAAETFAAQTGNRAYMMELTEQGPLGFGCDFHPNLAQHRLNAQELTEFIAEVMGW